MAVLPDPGTEKLAAFTAVSACDTLRLVWF